MIESGIISSDVASVVLAVVILVFVLILFKQSYIKAPPNKAACITGLSKNPRILLGRAGFKIPFFERVDWLKVSQLDINISTDDYIPTSDFIDIQVDAIAQVAMICDDEEGSVLAMRNFINKEDDMIKESIVASLRGNLREIIGTMSLKDICQNKTEFSRVVKENAEQDMLNLGIKILSLNVQSIEDKESLIEDLGIDNRAQIQKDAAIAKENAERDKEIAKAKAKDAADKARVEAELQIAERNNTLALKKAELQISEDKKQAEADAAGKIQEQISLKEINIREQEADIAKREKQIELEAREAEVAEKKLDAEVRKKAEADKYAEMQRADADLYKRQKEAEAKLYEQEKEAEAIKQKGEAEAKAIKDKGIAEAEAMEKKAEAMQKYGEAAILEMIVNILPDVAKAVAEPISSISDVKIIGGDSSGINNMSSNVPVVLAQVMESVKEATGIDINEIVRAKTYDAKVTRNFNINGEVPVSVDEDPEADDTIIE